MIKNTLKALKSKSFRLNAALGIDIGASRISAVEIVSDSGTLKVRRAGNVATPPDSVSRGAVTDPRAVGRAIEELFKANRLSARGRRVIVSLPGSGCVARLTGLPAGGPVVVREHIQEEIKRYAVFSGEKTVSDFVLAGPAGGSGQGRTAFLAAAREDSVAALLETMAGARIAPRAIDIAPLAVARALNRGIHSPGVRGGVIYATVEPDSVHLLVFSSAGLLFSHTAREEIDFSRSPVDAANRMSSIVRTVLDFYDTEIGSAGDVEKLVVVGDREPPVEAGDALRGNLGELAVVFSDPSTAVRDTGLEAEADIGEGSACALGLALRAFDDTCFRLSLNLVPFEETRSQEFKKRLVIAAIAAAALFLITLVGSGGIYLSQRSLEEEIAEYQKKIDGVALSPEMMEARNKVSGLQCLLDGEKKFLESSGPAVSWASLFETVKTIIPRDVRLLRLEEDGSGEMVILGESYSVDSVYQFAEPFGASAGVNSAKLSNLGEVERDGKAMIGFSMECDLDTSGQEKGEEL